MDRDGRSLEEGIQILWKSHGFKNIIEEFKIEDGYGVWTIKAPLKKEAGK